MGFAYLNQGRCIVGGNSPAMNIHARTHTHMNSHAINAVLEGADASYHSLKGFQYKHKPSSPPNKRVLDGGKCAHRHTNLFASRDSSNEVSQACKNAIQPSSGIEPRKSRDESCPQNKHRHQGVPSTTTTAIPSLCTILFAHYQALDMVLISTCPKCSFSFKPIPGCRAKARKDGSRHAWHDEGSNTGAAPASRGCRHAQEPTARARTRVHDCRNLILDFWVRAAIFQFHFILLAHHLYSPHFLFHTTLPTSTLLHMISFHFGWNSFGISCKD
jgi:hypothetical protein